MSPLDGQRGGEVTDTGLGGVVRSLRLGNVDDGAGHAANHDHAASGLALHEVAGDRGGKEVGAVNVDSPELTHTLDGVGDGVKVLGEAGRSDEVVNLAVLLDDVGDAGVDRGRVRDVGVMSSDLRDTLGVGVLADESLHEELGLLVTLVLCHGVNIQSSITCL